MANRLRSTGGMDLNTAGLQLAKEEAKKMFMHGIPYITGRTMDMVVTLCEQVRRLVVCEPIPHLGGASKKGFSFTSTWLMADNPGFDREITRVLEDWMFINIHEKLQDKLRSRADQIWQLTRINRAAEFEKTPFLLSPVREVERIVESRREARVAPPLVDPYDYYIDPEGCLRCVHTIHPKIEGEKKDNKVPALWPRPRKEVEGRTRQLILTREERMMFSGRWCAGDENAYQVREIRGREPTRADIVKTVEAFRSQFAVFRERFLMTTDEALETCFIGQLETKRTELRRDLLGHLLAERKTKRKKGEGPGNPAGEAELRRRYGFEPKVQKIKREVAKERRFLGEVHQHVEDIRHILASLRQKEVHVSICPYGERNAINTQVRHVY